MGIYISSGKYTLKVDSKFLKKLKIERTSTWLSNPSPGYIPRENCASKRCTLPMSTAALLTTAKTRKRSAWRWTEEWTKKMWHIYTMEYYSAIKRSHATCSNLDSSNDYHTKWHKFGKDKYHMIPFICGIEKNYTNELIYETETDTDFENKFRITKEERLEGGIN